MIFSKPEIDMLLKFYRDGKLFFHEDCTERKKEELGLKGIDVGDYFKSWITGEEKDTFALPRTSRRVRVLKDLEKRKLVKDVDLRYQINKNSGKLIKFTFTEEGMKEFEPWIAYENL
jgi:hypothetical protein